MSDSKTTPHPPDSLLDGLSPKDLLAEMMLPTQPVGAAPAVPPFSPEELAPHFPQLEILECLGRGGMGVVYKARQKSLNRLVALKLLAPERADDPQFAARFEKEAQALAALNHSHIVGVYDFGSVVQASGLPSDESRGLNHTIYYLLMEFIDGVNLRQLLQTKHLTPKEALSIVPPVCDALQCAHDHGIVHRDIKPENLLIDKAGMVKIADFGIAKIIHRETDTPVCSGSEQTGVSASLPQGTPDYAAPEQQSGTADHRADIYSLGVVLYEMLTGERPKENITPPSKRVQVDIRIDEIVLRALEKTPELRFATAAEFRTQVESAVEESRSDSRTSTHAGTAVFALPMVLIGGAACFLVVVFMGGLAMPSLPSMVPLIVAACFAWLFYRKASDWSERWTAMEVGMMGRRRLRLFAVAGWIVTAPLAVCVLALWNGLFRGSVLPGDLAFARSQVLPPAIAFADAWMPFSQKLISLVCATGVVLVPWAAWTLWKCVPTSPRRVVLTAAGFTLLTGVALVMNDNANQAVKQQREKAEPARPQSSKSGTQ